MVKFRDGMRHKKIYLMKHESGLVKIGVSIDPIDRRRQIQANSGIKTELVHSIDIDCEPFTLEAKLHRHYKHLRVFGEWFRNEDHIESDFPEEVLRIQEQLLEPPQKLRYWADILAKRVVMFDANNQIYASIPSYAREVDIFDAQEDAILHVLSYCDELIEEIISCQKILNSQLHILGLSSPYRIVEENDIQL